MPLAKSFGRCYRSRAQIERDRARFDSLQLRALHFLCPQAVTDSKEGRKFQLDHQKQWSICCQKYLTQWEQSRTQHWLQRGRMSWESNPWSLRCCSNCNGRANPDPSEGVRGFYRCFRQSDLRASNRNMTLRQSKHWRTLLATRYLRRWEERRFRRKIASLAGE